MRNLQTSMTGERTVISSFDRQFAGLHGSFCKVIWATSTESLYRRLPNENSGRALSVGESVLRGAAAVEQTFGGITANLWDDPFEWTLPENLSTPARIVEYLDEVEATRRLAFLSFARDADLLKEIMGPAGETRTLLDLLTETLVKAATYCGRSEATHDLLSDLTAP